MVEVTSVIWRRYFRNPTSLVILGVAATLVLFLVVVIVLLLTGGTTALSANAALIAAIVALGGVGTTQMVNTALENQRSQEAALQSYLEQMGNLIADPKRPLHQSTPGDNVSTLARAQTLSVLPVLGRTNKGPTLKQLVLQFLHDSNLIYKEKAIVDLQGANFNSAYLRDIYLQQDNLRGAYLNEADLRSTQDLDRVDLSKAKLKKADLRGANLTEADLNFADLTGAKLQGAHFQKANFLGAYVTKEQLDSAESLKGATMPDGSTHD